jgi:5-methylcytosine-specific restriction endonuclease McrA
VKRLTLPATAAQDDKVLEKLCVEEPWLAHKDVWLATYAAYRAARGNPWQIEPHAFDPDIAEIQRELYDLRKRNGPIRRIRETPGLNCCPMCGSPTTGSLDHFLPRAAFAEFSILRVNLVPACVHCNSASKGNTYKRAEPERFIHPYYDEFADDPLWKVEISAPYAAATFTAVPVDDLEEDIDLLVRFHLEHVLGNQFSLFMDTAWSTYPRALQIRSGGLVLAPAEVTASVQRDLAETEITMGVNGWRTAFLRGLLSNAGAIDYVAGALG